tara:strand:- start:663 stop:1115 length:453 start_codon:yes stop_codon:yes gene_type:complete
MVTDSEVAYFIAMFIVFVIAVSFSIGWAKADGIKPFSDKFELGYIEEDISPVSPVEIEVVDEYDELKDLKRQVEIAKLKQQLHDLNNPKPPIKPTQRPKPTKPAIFDDCVSALTGLGTPARKAKAEVQNIFDRNPNIKTVQDFITEYGKR